MIYVRTARIRTARQHAFELRVYIYACAYVRSLSSWVLPQVAMTRVRRREDIRILPPRNANSFRYLEKLRAPLDLKRWLAGLDAEGTWRPERVPRSPAGKHRPPTTHYLFHHVITQRNPQGHKTPLPYRQIRGPIHSDPNQNHRRELGSQLRLQRLHLVNRGSHPLPTCTNQQGSRHSYMHSSHALRQHYKI